jgi:polysaccharide deacetylase family protein (PEP-CTERM system associated)
MIPCLLTFDIEDWFQVENLRPLFPPERWESMPRRVADATRRVLGLLADRGIHSTFFVLGWVAEREPVLVRRIIDDGHEVASHGYDHTRATMLDQAAFKADVTRTKKTLEDLTGRAVRGYRAPSYSIGARNLWALDVLRDAGYVYSSSIYPIRHDLYGMPEAPRFAFRLHADAILELPVTTVEIAGRKLPAGGGGYFRLMPYPVYAWALRRVNDRDRQPGIFYFHPWEVDPDQPRIDGASLRSRFRHYVNLDTMEARLRRLLRDFRWGRMDEVFPLA